jgi:uncharacterized protein YkwD
MVGNPLSLFSPNNSESLSQDQRLPEQPEQDSVNTSQPAAIPKTVTSENTLQDLREYVLQLINEERKKFGLSPVSLSSNEAAQAHAEDLYQKLSSSSHWTSDGMKPYMRYTVYNGSGYVAQNVHAGLSYREADILQCRVGLAICEKINIRKTLEESEYSMMYDDAHADWGHRDNIIDKHHTHVSLGIVYDDYYFAHVQNFESRHIVLSQPISQENGSVRLQGSIDEGYSLASVIIYYDETPTVDVYNRDRDLESYGMGDAIAGLAEPGWYYDDILTIPADRWSIVNDKFDITFNISSLPDKSGVYTIVVFLSDNAESFPGLSYSIWKN